MATISGKTEERVFPIQSWGGLHENPDGDTKLKLGEAAAMRNFRITRDGNLQRRPGSVIDGGLLSAYTFFASGEQVVRVDHGVSSYLNMYPTVTVQRGGRLVLEGEPVTVTYENQSQYARNYYWKSGVGQFYKFRSCEKEGDRYLWKMSPLVVYGDASVEDMTYVEVAGLWAGRVKNTDYLMAVCNGHLIRVMMNDFRLYSIAGDIPIVGTAMQQVHMFGYSGLLYILTGGGYYQWDGSQVKEVEGYRPLVLITIDPKTGAGTTLEEVNKLTGAHRGWFSPYENARSFKLIDTDIVSVDYVTDRTTGKSIPFTWEQQGEGAGVTLESAPANGVNTLEIGWTVKHNDRARVEAMRFSETFSGSTDNRLFLYGDGTNQALYSGLDYDGNPRADYFPDMNVLKAGEENTPVTALVRHHSRLLVYKTDAAYSCQYGLITLADGSTKPAFYVTPVHRSIGNEAPGQVRMVQNTPFSLSGGAVYAWSNGSGSGNLTADERQVRRISDRVAATLGSFRLKNCICWDDKEAQEYYIIDYQKALVYNYAVDAWYFYDGLPQITCMARYHGKLYYGDGGGNLCEFDYRFRMDFGSPIRSYWESGSIDFGRDYMRKYSAMLWVGIKPEARGEVRVSVQTDRKSLYAKKLASFSLASLAHADFTRWSFNTNRKPHIARLKIKAKKFVFYKLIFETEATDTTVTILSADLRVRYTGYAK